MHASLPFVGLNVPTGHASQASPENPGIHVQFATLLDMDGEDMCSGQIPIIPFMQNVPGSHSLQFELLTPA